MHDFCMFMHLVDTFLFQARENVHRYTGKAKPDFEYLAVGAHSAGANSLLRTLNANKTTALVGGFNQFDIST